MFRIAKLNNIVEDGIDEESVKVEDSFFFTITVPNHFVIYNRKAEIIGRIPEDYFMFFRLGSTSDFEDIDIGNVQRLLSTDTYIELLADNFGKRKPKVIKSSDIAKIIFMEESPLEIPFTNYVFDSDGVFVFKNTTSLADTIQHELY